VVFCVAAPCSLLIVSDISEEHAACMFRAEVKKIRN
jgi:hypothetical protein